MEYKSKVGLENHTIIYIKETGKFYITYDEGDYSVILGTDGLSLEDLTDFIFNDSGDTKSVEGVDVTSKASREAQIESYMRQLEKQGIGRVYDEHNTFLADKGTGDLQQYVYLDMTFTQFDQAIEEHGTNALANVVNMLKKRKNAAPWFNDDNYLNELATWYIKHGEDGLTYWKASTHKQWLTENGYDPRTVDAWQEYTDSSSSFNEKIANYKEQLRDIVQSKGGTMSEEALEYAATEWAWGRWNAAKASNQVKLAVDSAEGGTQDAAFGAVLEGKGNIETVLQEDTVRADLEMWLPSSLINSGNYDIKELAGKYRTINGFRESFIEELKDDRVAMYGGYDRDISWKRILQGKKATASQVWGIDMSNIKDDDAAIVHMVTKNEPDKEAEYLRGVGLDRGYQGTLTAMAKDYASSYGTGIVQSAGFMEQ